MPENQVVRKIEPKGKKNLTLAVVSDSKSWLRSTTVILVCLIALGFFGKVVMSALIVQRQTKLDKITTTISDLDAANRSLLFEITKLESTERIYRVALAGPEEVIEGIQGLGMVHPDRTEYLQPLLSSDFSNWDDESISFEGRE